MSSKPPPNLVQSRMDKAEKTTAAATAIIAEERRTADSKVARLKALRLAREAEAPPPAPRKASRAKR
jgi:hypothetical protein